MEKSKVSVVVAEFLGTALLASTVLRVVDLFSLGNAAWYISLTVGMVLALIVGMFGKISGAHVNPAVTVGLWSLKKIESTQAVVYVAAQVLGGAVAFALYQSVTGNDISGLVDTSFDGALFFSEVIGTFIFGMGIAAAVYHGLKDYQAAFTIGAALTFGIMIATMTPGAPGFLNPAVALANNSLTVMYAIAPVVGMVLGMNVYAGLFAPDARVSTSSNSKTKVTRKRK